MLLAFRRFLWPSLLYLQVLAILLPPDSASAQEEQIHHQVVSSGRILTADWTAAIMEAAPQLVRNLDGSPRAIRIRVLRRDNPLYQFGFRANDVVRAINRTPTDNPLLLPGRLSEALSSRSLVANVERGSERIFVSLSIVYDASANREVKRKATRKITRLNIQLSAWSERIKELALDHSGSSSPRDSLSTLTKIEGNFSAKEKKLKPLSLVLGALHGLIISGQR